MKNINKLLLLMMVIFLNLACTKAPKLKIDTSGLKPKIQNRYFTIINEGNADLIIEDFTTSCECTVVNLEKGVKIKKTHSLKINLIIEKRKVGSGEQIVFMAKTNAEPQLHSFSFLL